MRSNRGLVSLTADDGPCQTGGDGEIICGYTIDYINVFLTNFVANGHSFNNGVIQTTQPVHVFSTNGQMTRIRRPVRPRPATSRTTRWRWARTEPGRRPRVISTSRTVPTASSTSVM